MHFLPMLIHAGNNTMRAIQGPGKAEGEPVDSGLAARRASGLLAERSRTFAFCRAGVSFQRPKAIRCRLR